MRWIRADDETDFSTENPHSFTVEEDIALQAVYEEIDIDFDSVSTLWEWDLTSGTEVTITGVVAAFTDRGYLLQDVNDTHLVSVWDDVNAPDIGDMLEITAEWQINFDIAQLREVSLVTLISQENPVNLSTENAVAIDWEDYDTTQHFNGQLAVFDGFFGRLAGTSSTNYLRVGHTQEAVDAQDYDGSYLGFQLGANNQNLTDPLLDYFGTEGPGNAPEYPDMTIYAFLYDSSASYQKFVIIADEHLQD